MSLTPNICLYDPFPTGLEGVAEEIRRVFVNMVIMFYGTNVLFFSSLIKIFGREYQS